MALYSKGHTIRTASIAAVTQQRVGRPQLRRSAMPEHNDGNWQNTVERVGSHMPLDTQSHWHWSNPLNLLPALLLVLCVVALVALAVAM